MKNVKVSDEESERVVNYRLCTLDEVPDWIKAEVIIKKL